MRGFYNPGLTSIVVNQFSKHFKIWYFSHRNRGSSVGKSGSSNGFNSCVKAVLLLTFAAYIENFVHNQTKYGCYTAERAGKLDN